MICNNHKNIYNFSYLKTLTKWSKNLNIMNLVDFQNLLLEIQKIINIYKQIYILSYIQYLLVLGIALIKMLIQRGFIMKLVDSHCHLNFPDLVNNLDKIFNRMFENNVVYALCVSVDLDSFLDIKKI